MNPEETPKQPEDQNEPKDRSKESFDVGEQHQENESPPSEDLWAELGIPAPNYSDLYYQEEAPPVDRDELRKLDRRELSEADTTRVLKLINKFETWQKARAEVLLERLR